MQIIYQNKNKGYKSREISVLDLNIYIGRISKYLKEEFTRKYGCRENTIWISRRFFSKIKKKSLEKEIIS